MPHPGRSIVDPPPSAADVRNSCSLPPWPSRRRRPRRAAGAHSPHSRGGGRFC